MRHRLPSTTIQLATLAALLLPAPPAAFAGALDVIGAPNSSNGLNARILARGPEATYFNPALLPDVGAKAMNGPFVLVMLGDISLNARPPGHDVPEGVYSAQLLNPDGTTSRLVYRPLASSELPGERADTDMSEVMPNVVLGLAHPIIKDRLAFGAYAMIPLRSFQETSNFFVDEREQYFSDQLQFELLGDRLGLPTISLALGGRITSWLSIGAGVRLGFKSVLTNSAHIPDSGDQREAIANPESEIDTAFAPHFAIAVRPIKMLRLAATAHLASSLEVEATNRIRFWNYQYPDDEEAIIQHLKFEYDYEPLRISVGAALLGPPAGDGAVKDAPPGWEVGAHAVYERWSDYHDRHAESPLDEWSDTVAVGLGGSVLFAAAHRVSLDLTFTPSPVPDQTGRTNYVDNARIGATASFETPVSLLGRSFGVGVYLQGQYLLPRDVEKSTSAKHPIIDEVADNTVDVTCNPNVEDDPNCNPIEGSAGLQTNNPGYPGFSSDGWILGAGVSLRFSL